MAAKSLTFILFFSFFILMSFESLAFDAVYYRGELNFKNGTPVKLVKNEKSLSIQSKNKKNEAFSINWKDMRGVQTTTSGTEMWIYWYEGKKKTHKAHFTKMDNVEGAISMINKMIKKANTDPNIKYEERWKRYREKALRESE